MKIKTLSKKPFVICWVLSIPLTSFLISIIYNVFSLYSNDTKYLVGLILFTLISILLFRLFTGELFVKLNEEKKHIEINWSKKPILTKIENQIIKLSEIRSLKKSHSRLTDRLQINLLKNEKVKIDFNNLIDYGKNFKKRELIIYFIDSKQANG